MTDEKGLLGPTVINAAGDALLGFISVDERQLETLDLDAPLRYCYVIARHQTGFLLVFNRWRRRWELPGGTMEPGETPRACAIRELQEETNQTSTELRFEGLLRFRLRPSNRIEYGALYSGKIDQLETFQANDEIEDMLVWDLRSDIGYIEEISRALIDGYDAG